MTATGADHLMPHAADPQAVDREGRADRTAGQNNITDRVDEEGMSGHDDAAQELAHTDAMILQLEHLVHDNDVGQAITVTTPDYL